MDPRYPRSISLQGYFSKPGLSFKLYVVFEFICLVFHNTDN